MPDRSATNVSQPRPGMTRGSRRDEPPVMGFAGIEAFCAFLAVATHRICQPRQESLFERNAAG
jgi:hypothetical protein